MPPPDATRPTRDRNRDRRRARPQRAPDDGATGLSRRNATEPDEPELLELRCGSVAAGGSCVARAGDGRVVFVRHGLPGELVRARVTAVSARYLRADAVEILEPSAARVEPPCPHAGPGRCGGCDFQHVAPSEQRAMKAALVMEQLRRIARVERDVTVEELTGSPDGLGWRTRVRFAADLDGRVGMRRHRSHDVEPVEHCLVAAESVRSTGVETCRWPPGCEVEVLAPVRDPPAPAGPRARPGRGRDDLDARDGANAVVSVTLHGRARATPPPRPLAPATGLVAGGRVVRPPGHARADVLGHGFRVSAGSFWQAHRDAPRVLGQAVLDGLEPRRGEAVLDLFAGVGLFSVLCADAVGPGGRVLAVERDRGACADARHNARRHPQVEVREDHVSPAVVASLGGFDLVVLDPPREGAGTALVDCLVSLDPAPRRVAYVACDPASFARDLAVIAAAGWTTTSLRAFDQFPMTEHVELVAIVEPPATARRATRAGGAA